MRITRVARTIAGRALAGGMAMLASASASHGQSARRVQVEARVDGIFAAFDAVHAGLGANVPVGNYVRLGALGAVGASFANGRSRSSQRADVAARFVVDPLRQMRWSPYGGGGLTLRHEHDAGWRGYILFVLGMDGPTMGAVDPAFELGLGGGTRIGIIVRRARRDRR